MQIRYVLAFFAFLSPFYSSAFDLTPEPGLTRILLPSGVQGWIRENAIPPHFTAVRIVAKTAAGLFTYAKECQDETLEEIDEFFSDYVYQIGDNLDSLGVIAVGDFSSEEMAQIIGKYFDNITLSNGSKSEDLLPKSTVEVCEVRGEIPRNFLTLSYVMPSCDLYSLEDLKKMWSLSCLQKMIEGRLKISLKESGGEMMLSMQGSFPLASPIFKSEVMYGQESALELLAEALLTVQDCRRKGFSQEELSSVKQGLKKNLLSVSQGNPDSMTLAGYLAAHFGNPWPVPDYAVFMNLSPTILSEISLAQVHDLFKDCFVDEGRRVELQTSIPVDPQEVKETLDLFKAGTLVLDLRSEEDHKEPESTLPGDSFTRLPITADEAETIWKIIDTVANNNVIKLGLKKGDLERKGKKIHHVHPLRFLSTIFSNPHLKKCMKDVRDNYFKWTNFMGGVEERMNEEWDRNNLYPHVNGFSAVVKAHPDQVRIFIQARDWEGLVKYLIRVE